MNCTLDGLAKELELRFGKNKTRQSAINKVHLVRYADDFIITGCTKELLEFEVKPLVESFLKERGLKLSPNKTRVTSIHEGFDFLGQNIRKYRKEILLITPSLKSQRAFKDKVNKTLKKLRTAPQNKVINALNPIITGWGNYHQHVVSKHIYSTLDNWLWQRLWHWSYRRHPMKSKRWVSKRYYNSIGLRQWVFSGIENSKGKTVFKKLRNLGDIPIRRHVKIKGNVNPYDKIWELYLEQRNDNQMKKQTAGKVLSLYKRQKGLCPWCHLAITPDSRWNIHHKLERIMGGSDKLTNLVLLHPLCHKQLHYFLTAGLPIPGSLAQA